MKFNKIEITFDNGDKLLAEKKVHSFAGYKPVEAWCMFYAELQHKDIHLANAVYAVSGAEYFPATASCCDMMESFSLRANQTKPTMESGVGMNFDDVFEKEKPVKEMLPSERLTTEPTPALTKLGKFLQEKAAQSTEL